MFDEVTRREGGRRAARRGIWVAASSGVQALVVVGVIVIFTKIPADVANGPVVDVKFVKQAAPPPPSVPPPPPAPRRDPPPRAKVAVPKPHAPSPMAVVQPKEVPRELNPPGPEEAPEPEPAHDEGRDTGQAGGVVGGVAGGVTGGVVGAPGAAPQEAGIGDAPVFASAGFKQPAEAQRGCVGQSVRIPRDLAGRVSSVTVKFAVNRDGSVSGFQVMGSQPDPRIGQAIWQAIRSCRFTPGADAQGRPVAIWLLLPLRFVSG